MVRAPGLGRITGSASIETLVRVGLEKEAGLSPDSKMVVLHDFTPCVDDELEVKRGSVSMWGQEYTHTHTITHTYFHSILSYICLTSVYTEQVLSVGQTNITRDTRSPTHPPPVCCLPQVVNVLYQENDWVYVIAEHGQQEGFIPHSYCAPFGSQLGELTINHKVSVTSHSHSYYLQAYIHTYLPTYLPTYLLIYLPTSQN